MDFGGPATVGIKFGADGSLSFHDERGQAVSPRLVEIGKSYDRANKKSKVITRSWVNPESINLDPNKNLAAFGSVVAVDTNTDRIADTRVSISVALLMQHIVSAGPRSAAWSAKLTPLPAVEFHDSADPPEIFGWLEIIERARQLGLKGQVGVVVDHDMNRLTEYNSRKAPLLLGVPLPDDITLIYASAERGTEEHIANAAMALCDRNASRILKRLKAEGLQGDYEDGTGRSCRRYRYWPVQSKK
jgi:hypothetical protein